MTNLKFESLHSHTKLSDGVMSHAEVLAAAEKHGIGTLAFTDHDTLPDADAMAQLKAYTGPVQWTLGIELTSYVPVAAGGPEKGAVHILGLFVDLKNKALTDFCAQAEAARFGRMQHYVKHLRSLGFTISEADVQSQAPSKTIVSPHIVKALWLHEENQVVFERLKAEFVAAAEHDPHVKAKLEQTLKDGPNQWPYTLFMGGHSYFAAPKADFNNLMPYEESVELIRGAGGLAIAAHWYLEPEKMTQADLVAVLEAGGLDGIESEVENVINDRDNSEATRISRELIKQYNLVETMGSDSHTEADLAAFAKAPVAEHSVGQTARLIEQRKPDLRWSRLA